MKILANVIDVKNIKVLKIAIPFTAVFLLAVYFFMPEIIGGNSNPSRKVFELSSSEMKWVDSVMTKLTIEEKCAQLIIASASTYMLEDGNEEYFRLENLVKNTKVGGLIFFKGNLKEQVLLTNKLQAFSETPLIIAADYERGLGMRIEDAVEFPYNMALAATGDTNLTYELAKLTAQEARKIGVHWNFAPIVDVNHDYRNPIINIRSFSENPEIVANHATAYIRGMRDGGMISTAKHFPGHGATDVDSHNEIPTIEQSLDDLELLDIKPFEDAIQAGVHSIMIGHLTIPALEEEESLPATFSKNIITKVLKEKLGFQGLVITDAMNMHSITNNYSHKEAAVKSILAGNDVVLFPADPVEAAQGLIEAVKDETLSQQRIETSLRKLLIAKKWLGLDTLNSVDTTIFQSGLISEYHKNIARQVARKAITLVKNENNLIPINPEKYKKIVSISFLTSYRKKDDLFFEKFLPQEIEGVEQYQIVRRSKKRDFRNARALVDKADLIILPLFISVRSFEGSVDIFDEYKELLKYIFKKNKPTITISLGNPYLLAQLPDVKNYICSFGAVDVSQQAAIEGVMGKYKIDGKLPVSIPNSDFKIGFGESLAPFQYSKLNSDYSDSTINFNAVDSLMNNAVSDRIFPGGTLLVGNQNGIVYSKSFGNYDYAENSKKVNVNSIFDLASLTKVIATTSAAMILVADGRLKLEEKVVDILPDFENNGKEQITVKNLLLHNSGLPAFKQFYKNFSSSEDVLNDIFNSELVAIPGEKYIYSDLGFVVLQKVIEQKAMMSLDLFLKNNLFEPLNLQRTFFNPKREFVNDCLPTEVDQYWRNRLLQGEVHDETASLLNGVSGNAGLFSSSMDIAKIVYTLMNNGRFGNVQIFDPNIVKNWTSKQSDQSSRGLGWDTKSEMNSSAGDLFSMNTFGHTGYTGTSVWADKENNTFVVLLTNRVNPTRDNTSIIGFRPKIHNAIFNAINN
ncbi:MAG: serine hydrolase [Melioribacteraceae bacterium]|nr:serine hydrolase [Melioribacteraceae bacterium]